MAKVPSFSSLSLPDLAAPGCLEGALVHAEASLGVRITVSDHAALFLDDAGKQALPEARRRHHMAYCEWGRAKPGWDRACLAHCGRAVPLHAGEVTAPFVHHCWKGAAEIVVPIHFEGAHACTLFAGLWRSPHMYHAPLQRPMPRELKGMALAMPMMAPAAVTHLSGALQLLGAGLVGMWVRRARWGDAHDRVAQIRRFIHMRAHENIRLDDLAQHLSLSPSHAGTLVRKALGRSFQDALIFERLRRARTLLKQTRRSVKEIAARVGFRSAYYFSRVFTKATGQSPGRWRKAHAADEQPAHEDVHGADLPTFDKR